MSVTIGDIVTHYWPITVQMICILADKFHCCMPAKPRINKYPKVNKKQKNLLCKHYEDSNLGIRTFQNKMRINGQKLIKIPHKSHNFIYS